MLVMSRCIQDIRVVFIDWIYLEESRDGNRVRIRDGSCMSDNYRLDGNVGGVRVVGFTSGKVGFYLLESGVKEKKMVHIHSLSFFSFQGFFIHILDVKKSGV